MVVVIVVRRGHEGRRVSLAAMACGAGDGHAGVGHLADVLSVDLSDHLVHESRGVLFRLGVAGEVEPGMAVPGGSFGVDRVAMLAADSESLSPVVHDVVDLLEGEVLGQHLKVFGWGHGRHGMGRAGGRRGGRLADGKCRGEREGGKERNDGLVLQNGDVLVDGMTSTTGSDGESAEKDDSAGDFSWSGEAGVAGQGEPEGPIDGVADADAGGD